MKELEHARELMKVHILRSQQDIRRRQERASILATTGGSPGIFLLIVQNNHWLKICFKELDRELQ